eukprot:TRINITY_DN7799_c0_g2_i1.p1 TRINITY_DN7799_c0_g2~~TRINITY_DN7799_c0_g2_i1.p1  ORF type:complete len:146 (-),score=34.81 TRINITY_DN7799_c0_g2_i1:317-754(-)
MSYFNNVLLLYGVELEMFVKDNNMDEYYYFLCCVDEYKKLSDDNRVLFAKEIFNKYIDDYSDHAIGGITREMVLKIEENINNAQVNLFDEITMEVINDFKNSIMPHFKDHLNQQKKQTEKENLKNPLFKINNIIRKRFKKNYNEI